MMHGTASLKYKKLSLVLGIDLKRWSGQFYEYVAGTHQSSNQWHWSVN